MLYKGTPTYTKIADGQTDIQIFYATYTLTNNHSHTK